MTSQYPVNRLRWRGAPFIGATGVCLVVGVTVAARQSQELEEVAECVVCMDASAQITLQPCGHHITCSGCTRALIMLKKPCAAGSKSE